MKIEKSPNLSEVAISYRTKVKAKDRLKVSSSFAANEVLKSIYDVEIVEHHEEFVILLLNRAMHVLGWVKTNVGGLSAILVDNRIIFQYALLANASAIILSHNHPSGIALPSEQDKAMTKKIVEGGKILEIAISDHIIYTTDNYFSFADEGLM